MRRDELGILVDVDVVLVAIVVLIAFLRPACLRVFLRPFGRSLAPVNATAPTLMMALVSRPLRWIGAGTKVVSTIWPLLSSPPPD